MKRHETEHATGLPKRRNRGLFPLATRPDGHDLDG